jgi:hypothetical protein
MITGKNIGFLVAFFNSSLFKFCFIDRSIRDAKVLIIFDFLQEVEHFVYVFNTFKYPHLQVFI